MSESHRPTLQEHWAQLGKEPTSGPDHIRTSELPIETSQGKLLAAVDHDGCRHLLVPLNANQHVRRDRGSTALEMRERPLETDDLYERYADLGCLRKDLDPVFTGLCADVLEAAESDPGRPLKALYTVVDRWRALFLPSPTRLRDDQLTGLFGEMVVLNQLLLEESTAVDFWTGPSGHRHDFTVGRHDIEVKASITAKDRRIRIHGAEQLQPPVHGTLDLVWLRLEQVSAGGRSLPELVNSATQHGDDDNGLLFKLAQAGYSPADAHSYRNTRFAVLEHRWYEVDDTFPRIDPAAAPSGVSDVHYTVDLDKQSPAATETSGVATRIRQITQERE
ncbi:PD-(D/E)XK motif protein [Amycolatopsis sp. NBC_01480]|uniref:PD-(D/E)XK motif protein n=1 Tax=Amycolatopsis sp. NBC_01480 TaxID=2903562 RepID=UPI002E2BC563|nr:PD-(D/E)XK motif protein [Amycolatopsis sp. NBC_01480]